MSCNKYIIAETLSPTFVGMQFRQVRKKEIYHNDNNSFHLESKNLSRIAHFDHSFTLATMGSELTDGAFIFSEKRALSPRSPLADETHFLPNIPSTLGSELFFISQKKISEDLFWRLLLMDPLII